MTGETKKTIIFRGRRKGKRLRGLRMAALESVLARFGIATLAPERVLNPAALFDFVPREVWLEIGFGNGEHLAAQAIANPDVGFIGCEPFVNGVSALCRMVEEQGISNIRIFPEDARILMDAMPDACISRCFVLFADPWPKTRHQDRRFIGPENLPRLARLIKPGGELRLATDDPTLQAWTLAQVKACPDFELMPDCATNIHAPPPDWQPTRYEQKATAAGRQPIYLRLARKEKP